MNPSPGVPALEIFLLGLVDFQEVLSLQRRIVYEMGDGGGASLLLCEHPPTISVGRAGSRAHVVPDDDGLRALGIRTQWVNRGGGCVLHLPGQLVAYPVVPLQSCGLTLSGYLEGLHQAVLGVLDEFDLRGSVRADLPGVFLGQARVASVGVAVNRWIAYHGLTSMESRRQRCTPMPKVRESLIRHLERVLGFERHHVYTGHPLIRRKVLSHVYAPSPG